MKIKEVMSSNIFGVTPETTYADAAKLMHTHERASLPVLNDFGSLIGIVSEKDLFRALYPKYSEFYRTPSTVIDEEQYEDAIEDLRSQPIRDFMTKEVLTVSSHEPIMKAGSLMLSHHIHHLPVVDDGKFIGIVSREDVFSAVLKSHLGF